MGSYFPNQVVIVPANSGPPSTVGGPPSSAQVQYYQTSIPVGYPQQQQIPIQIYLQQPLPHHPPDLSPKLCCGLENRTGVILWGILGIIFGAGDVFLNTYHLAVGSTAYPKLFFAALLTCGVVTIIDYCVVIVSALDDTVKQWCWFAYWFQWISVIVTTVLTVSYVPKTLTILVVSVILVFMGKCWEGIVIYYFVYPDHPSTRTPADHLEGFDLNDPLPEGQDDSDPAPEYFQLKTKVKRNRKPVFLDRNGMPLYQNKNQKLGAGRSKSESSVGRSKSESSTGLSK